MMSIGFEFCASGEARAGSFVLIGIRSGSGRQPSGRTHHQTVQHRAPASCARPGPCPGPSCPAIPAAHPCAPDEYSNPDASHSSSHSSEISGATKTAAGVQARGSPKNMSEKLQKAAIAVRCRANKDRFHRRLHAVTDPTPAHIREPAWKTDPSEGVIGTETCPSSAWTRRKPPISASNRTIGRNPRLCKPCRCPSERTTNRKPAGRSIHAANARAFQPKTNSVDMLQ